MNGLKIFLKLLLVFIAIVLIGIYVMRCYIYPLNLYFACPKDSTRKMTDGNPRYGIGIGNYTGLGVIIHELPVRSEFLPRKELDPTIPGTMQSVFKFSGFVDTTTKLPNEVILKWQLAELKNCRKDISAKINTNYTSIKFEDDGRIYHRKSGCDWYPLSDKIYETTLDLRVAQKSEAFEKLGQKMEDGGYYGADLMILIYGEDDIRVTTVLKKVSRRYPGLMN